MNKQFAHSACIASTFQGFAAWDKSASEQSIKRNNKFNLSFQEAVFINFIYKPNLEFCSQDTSAHVFLPAVCGRHSVGSHVLLQGCAPRWHGAAWTSYWSASWPDWGGPLLILFSVPTCTGRTWLKTRQGASNQLNLSNQFCHFSQRTQRDACRLIR